MACTGLMRLVVLVCSEDAMLPAAEEVEVIDLVSEDDPAEAGYR